MSIATIATEIFGMVLFFVIGYQTGRKRKRTLPKEPKVPERYLERT